MFGGGHISGHSGTDFKHNKAFSKLIEQYSNPIRNQKRVKFDSVDGRQSERTTRWIQINLLLAVLIISSIGLSIWMITNVPEAYRSNIHPQATEAQQKLIAQHIDDGARYMAEGDITAAQKEITQALRIDRHSLSANIAMFKLLNEQCQVSDESCSLAYEYKAYLESKRGVSLNSM